MLHIHVPLFHLLSCNSLLHPQVKLERSRIAPIILWSIPAGRGKVALCIVDVHAIGITPVQAGKSLSRMTAPNTPQGSPPHGRGKEKSISWRSRSPGITPAWAGKSHWMRLVLPVFEDHPRMGGEKINTAISDYLLEGSPPHGRGKVAKKYGVPESTRITPAWAGKRATPRKNGCPGGDHPRVGGEKRFLE